MSCNSMSCAEAEVGGGEGNRAESRQRAVLVLLVEQGRVL